MRPNGNSQHMPYTPIQSFSHIAVSLWCVFKGWPYAGVLNWLWKYPPVESKESEMIPQRYMVTIRDEITPHHQIKSNTHLASVPAVRCCHGAAFLYTQLCLQMLRLPIWQHLGLSPNVSFTFYKQTHLRIICISEEHRSLERSVNCAQMKAWHFSLAILQFK